MYSAFCKCGCGAIVYGLNTRTKLPRQYVHGHNGSKKHLSKSKGWLMKSGYRSRVIRGKQVLEHRYLMELYLGRKLKKDEYVDHINGIKDDNRIENLRLCTKIQNEHYYYGITQDDIKKCINKLIQGASYRKSIMGTNIKTAATARNIAIREGLR